MANFYNRVKNAWNAFLGRDPTYDYIDYGVVDYIRPDRFTFTPGSIKSGISNIFVKIAVDVMMVDIKHVQLDEEDRFKEVIKDELNDALTKSANLDQSGRAMILDLVESMFDEGYVAAVPVTTEGDPDITDSYKVLEIRVGKIVEWYPQHIKVEVYNQDTGRKEQIIMPKRYTPIITNPFYELMNEPNSKVKRLNRLLQQLDRSNTEAGSGKLNFIFQLPFPLKTKRSKEQAELRRAALEDQLKNSPLGIGYIDATEKVIQLNRSVENNFWEQAMQLSEEIFNEMGLSKSVFDGTADEATLINYHNRTLAPILSAITEEFERKWLTKTAVTQGEAIRYFKDPFKIVPVSQLAEIVDKFTRNCIMTSNEMRGVLGFRPIDDEKANQLINHNLNQPEEKETEQIEDKKSGKIQNEVSITKKFK